MEHTMILALHSLADIFTKIRYSWGQCPKKKHPFFWAAQIEFDTFHFCGKLPKLWAGEGVGFGQCPKEMFFFSWCLPLRIIRKLSRLFRYISGSSILFLEYPDKFFRLSGHFLHHMNAFQFIPTLFRSSRIFPVHPDFLHIIWIYCIVSGHFPKYPEILQQIISLLQKLSGFAKTLRSALLTRWRGFSDSVYMLLQARI